MMKDDYMGETGNMVIANGMSQLYTGARDVDPYSAFDDVLDADGGVTDIDFSEFRSGASRRARSRMGGKEARRRKLNKVAGYYPPVAVARAVKRSRNKRSSESGNKKRTGVGGFFQKTGESIRGGISNWRDQKNKEAQQQQALIAQAQASAPTAEQLNALLAPSSANVQAEQQNTKMSPTLKWGLIIGGVAVAGFVGYLVYKRMKNKAK